MTLLIALTVLSVLVAGYVVFFRPWLRQREWAAGFFAVIEPFEIALYRKSETLLRARFKMLAGLLVTALAAIGTLDLTPLVLLVPAQHQDKAKALVAFVPLLVSLSGFIDEALRRDTTKPLERVEIPEAVKAEPEVAKAEAKADLANATTVEVAKEAEKKV